MHIALFCPAWPPERFQNGIVTYVKWLREELLAAGHAVSVFTPQLEAAEPGIYLVQPTLADRARAWLRPLQGRVPFEQSDWGPVIGRAIRRVHGRNPIDVLEMEESFGLMADVERVSGIPTVAKLHGPAFMSIVEEEVATPAAHSKIAREGEALRRMRIITAPARRTLDETIAFYHLCPPLAAHIPNPLRLPPSVPLWDLQNCDRSAILFVGRFDKRKGGDLMLQAFAEVLRSCPDARLMFVGPDLGIATQDGQVMCFDEMKAALFSAAEVERVTYLGKLPPEEIYELRTRALVTVSASRWENQSYATLEAMLQGCPTVSSDAGGQGEILADGITGRLTRVGDAEHLAETLVSMMKDPAGAAELGRRARQHVAMAHDPQHLAMQTMRIYEQAIAMTNPKVQPSLRPSLQDRSLGG